MIHYLYPALLPATLLCIGVLVGCNADTANDVTVRDASETTLDVARGDTIVVTGTLLDVSCHADVSDQESLEATRSGQALPCEGDHVLQGLPVGLRLDEDESVWILMTVPQAMVDYLLQTARVSGIVRSSGVLVPQQIEIREGSEWVAIL